MTVKDRIPVAIGAAAMLLFAMRSHAQAQSDAELATKLNNTVASLVSVPFQFNWDHEIGPERDGRRFTLNIQPVVPTKVSSERTLISRVIVPIAENEIGGNRDGTRHMSLARVRAWRPLVARS